ncbi:unnamed protein product [Polarella glacialis]|uniref:Protein xylosyltransferase n=1 Tax=Polarella glacialis TaxID=89957 RepID=A0A813E7L6_POLGL|nr:unnamed protein product [Polarella glacialis]
MATWSSIGPQDMKQVHFTGALAASPSQSPFEATRTQLERYMCHSSVGVGVAHLLATRPRPAIALIRAGRRQHVGKQAFPAGAVGGFAARRKVAFLFMVYRHPNFPRLWRRFFADARAAEYKIVVHASHQEKVLPDRQDNERHFFSQHRIPWRPSEWYNISLVLLGLFEEALRDPAVEKALVISGDMVPLVPFLQVRTWALADRDRSWLCTDHEFTRAEPWMLLSRRHMGMLTRSQQDIIELLEDLGMCDAEELVPQALHLLGESKRIRNRCVVFTEWALPKYFAVGRSASLGRSPPLIGDFMRQRGTCGHPQTFESISVEGFRRLLSDVRPGGHWFARKFLPTSIVPGPVGETTKTLEDFLLAELFGEVTSPSCSCDKVNCSFRCTRAARRTRARGR